MSETKYKVLGILLWAFTCLAFIVVDGWEQDRKELQNIQDIAQGAR